MKTFPMFLTMAGRRVVIVGGGEQAAQKARLMLKTEAALVLVAPELDPELRDLVATGRAGHRAEAQPDVFDNAALVFVATGCKGADAAWHGRAKAAGALVNVVDYPALCDAMTPSIVDRDPVVVAIGTEGTAPLLARQIRSRIETLLHPRLGSYAALAGRLRAEVARRVPASRRRSFWAWVFAGAPWHAFTSGQERAAARQIKDGMEQPDTAASGHLCIVLGAADPGLIPMAAVQRLQDADVIYSDPDVPGSVLELARRDAARVQTAPEASGGPMRGRLASVLSAAAGEARVVYLTGSRAPLAVDPADGLPVSEQILCGASVAPTGPEQRESGQGA